MPYSSNHSSVEAIASRLLKQQNIGLKGNQSQNVSTVLGPTNDSSYENQNIVFSNQNLVSAVASISQQNVRSGMNNTSAQVFGILNESLASNRPRNSVVGARHIPITKFSRGHARARVGGEGPSAKNRVTSINFYQNSNQQSNKLQNAIDISLNKFDTKQSIVLNDSMNQTSSHIFIGSKLNSSYTHVQGSGAQNMYASA